MPTAIDSWEKALQILSNHNQALCPPPRVNSAFWVPPVCNIISPANPEMVRLLFQSWLQLHEIILTQLGSGLPLRLTSKQWQSLLEVMGWRYGKPNIPTTTGQHHHEMHQLLNQLCISSAAHEGKDISLWLVSWNGTPLILHEDIPPQISHEIIWEILELSFHNDLVMLNSQLNNSSVELAE
ncbi:hypothetical protein GYMLUDRAFT_172668 [Collybiopsis luxurians FD-317 M1]|uniref:Uncharacterized protein n=1 Tax=Collybiopsis luxurians FD-317 M1 TaxID=944289 RepID=A0A0D0C539_9AGAR|nr:hypothetical protein GYMLUDRAFT_172668 [Collybiopsis luxurians FD-317 M1]